MKIKIIAIMLLASTAAYAQLPEKGDWLIGTDVARLSIPISKPGMATPSTGELALMGGLFVSKRVVLGMSIPVTWQSSPGLPGLPSLRSRSLSYALVPFARFYLTDTRIRPYLAMGVGYLSSQYKFGQDKVSHDGLTYNGNVGVAYFINRHMSLDAVANITGRPNLAQRTFSPERQNQLNFHLRFQIFLGK